MNSATVVDKIAFSEPQLIAKRVAGELLFRIRAAVHLELVNEPADLVEIATIHGNGQFNFQLTYRPLRAAQYPQAESNLVRVHLHQIEDGYEGNLQLFHSSGEKLLGENSFRCKLNGRGTHILWDTPAQQTIPALPRPTAR